MWDALEAITRLSERSLSQILTDVDLYRPQSSLTSAVRVFILNFYRAAAEHAGESPRQWVDAAVHGNRLPHLRKRA